MNPIWISEFLTYRAGQHEDRQLLSAASVQVYARHEGNVLIAEPLDDLSSAEISGLYPAAQRADNIRKAVENVKGLGNMELVFIYTHARLQHLHSEKGKLSLVPVSEALVMMMIGQTNMLRRQGFNF